jgi:hypothetical protein
MRNGKKIKTNMKTFNNYLESKLQKVKAVKDDSGHWYVIPNDLLNEFSKDLENEDLSDSGEFDSKYGQYLTGGDLNLFNLCKI